MGHEAEHVIELGLESAADREIWELACSQSLIIVTKDEDFRAMRLRKEDGPQVIWLRIGNTTTPVVLNKLSDVWTKVIEALERGEPVIEIT